MKSSNAISIKNPVCKVIGHVKRLTTMVSSLMELVRDKGRVDCIYDESIVALREWRKKERERLDKLEETVRNRFESIEMNSHRYDDLPIMGFMEDVDTSSDVSKLIEEINLALEESAINTTNNTKG